MVDTKSTRFPEDAVEKADTGDTGEPSTGSGSSTDSSASEETERWRSVTSRCICDGHQHFGSTGSLMPRFLRDVLHSVSQVVFITNSVSGALLLLAMLLAAPRGAFVLGFLGALCATSISWLVGLDQDARKEGLLGYNAVLVGAGFAVFVRNFLTAAAGTAVFASLSALLAAGLSRLVKPHLTLSFNVCILLGLALIHLAEIDKVTPQQALHSKAKEAIFQWTSDFPLLDGLDFLKATLNGVAEIFLVSGPLGGILVLIAICLAEPVGALSTLLGSLIATLGAAGCGADLAEVKEGIWGFNAALTSLWVALHFRSRVSHLSLLLLVLFVSLCSTGLFAALTLAFEQTNGWMKGPFTLPFNAVGFFLVGIERCVLQRNVRVKQRSPECTEENMTTP